MSSPVMMETVRDVPAPNDTEQHIPTDSSHSGFPFDDHDFDEGDRSTHFRSQLDDLAQRHPELAEHLNFGSTFPFRSHTLGRHRRGSNENPSGSHDAEFKRYTDRPFGPRLAHFGFPFSRHFDDEPDFYQPAPAPPPPPQQPQQQSQQTQTEVKEPPSSPQPQPIHIEKPPPFPAQESSGRKQNIQQSNTVDLGQKQDPVDENRGQRSMSAPPENRPSGQRFVSSIKIPIQRPGGADMGVRASQPQSESQSTQTQQPPQSHRPNERVIPIHVEGRDEPVIPKNANTSFAQPPPPPPQQQRQQSPPPEKIFGRNPTQFTQFLNKGEPPGPTPEDIYKQQQQQYQQQQQKNYQQYQQQQEEEPQVQSQPQPEPSSTIPTQIAQIQSIQKDVSELMNQVEKFEGKPRDKQYLYLDEMLTRNLIKLDNIETEGKENIRQTRKEAIKCIEGCIGILEAKANANAARDQQNETKMEVEEQPIAEGPPEETQEPQPSEEMPNKEQPDVEATQQPTDSNILEVSGVSRSGTVVSVPDQTPMEVTHAEVDKVEEVQKPEETKTEVAVESVATTAETPAENLEVSDASQVKTEVVQEEKKKEKKKGKKKEKAENK